MEDNRGLGVDFVVVSMLVPLVEKSPGDGNAASGAVAIASASSIKAGGGKYSVLAFGGHALRSNMEFETSCLCAILSFLLLWQGEGCGVCTE